jgi:uncharacterized protein YlxW (UPF0749 family)
VTENNKKDVKLLVIVAVVLIIAAIILPRLGGTKDTPDVKNRVPTLVDSQLQAQKAAQDAQAARDQAQAAAKDIQDKIDEAGRRWAHLEW